MVWVWLIFSSVSEPPRLERDELETEKGGRVDPVNWMTRPVYMLPRRGFLCFIPSSEIGRGPRADSIIDKKSARGLASSFDAISVCIMHARDKFRYPWPDKRTPIPSPHLLFILPFIGKRREIFDPDNHDDVNISTLFTGILNRANLFRLESHEVKIIPSRDARVSIFEAWPPREMVLSTVDTIVLNAPIVNGIFRPFETNVLAGAPSCRRFETDRTMIFGEF